MRAYAFETLKLPQLISLIRVSNGVSWRVAEKIGMILVEEFTRYEIHCWKYALSAT